MTALGLFLGVIMLLSSLPAFVLLAEVVSAWAYRKPLILEAGDRPDLAVLIPAHNEASVLEATIRSITPQLSAGDRLIVVADNCTDHTAALGRSLGAEVVERSDEAKRGKGFALDAGIRHLSLRPPGLVAFIDADCVVAEGCLHQLAAACMHFSRPVQGTNIMRSDEGDLRNRIAEFAWRVRNVVRPSGGSILKLPTLLMGTGMILRWEHVRLATFATSSIVEDMDLGIQLTLGGHSPVFVSTPPVVSSFPTHLADQVIQRTRWEHGHLGTILQKVPRLLFAGVVLGKRSACRLALVLIVPPLALLALIQTSQVVIAMGLWLSLGASMALPGLIALFGLGALMIGLVSAWFQAGRDLLGIVELLSFPRYVLGKFNVYRAFVVGRQKLWTRARRDGE
ncbi:MAG: glycosyltransferase [Alphaproteobacteria bacterium]|nr:MAG: glycosyltransferase [Alphaproteobacteria bacterium]